VIDVDLTKLSDAELAALERVHPRDFTNPLSLATAACRARRSP
jgi:hypothetical protein